MATVARWLPWVLVALALGLFLVIPDANGPVLVVIWGSIVAVVRFGVGLLPDRTSRLWADAVVVLGCFLTAFEGGWYLLPAAVAFAVKDRGSGTTHQPFRHLTGRKEWVAGLAAGAIGIVGLAVALWGPFYASRSATITADSIVEGPLTSTSLFAVGLTPRAVVVLLLAASLLGIIAVASFVHARTGNRWARRLLGRAIVGLAIIAVAGAFTIGAVLLPAIALAIFAWVAGARRNMTA